MHERIKQARLAKKMTQADLAEKIGVTPQSVQQWESHTEPRKARLMTIAEILGVDVNWLLFGDLSKKDNINIEQVAPEEITSWDNSVSLDNNEVEIPYYNSIELAASHACSGEANGTSYKLKFSRAVFNRYGVLPSDAIAFPIQGDSMSPVIPDSSTVTVITGYKKIVDGGVYAIEQGDLLRVRILLRQPEGKLIIRSYNSVDYPDEIAEASTVNIIGRIFNWSVMGW
ncbi:repressor [Xenorhabdus stockiae]|uniref:Repressor n=1 Tax=Xenorhabdus stockiae TaxID=351614 RepID=A0A2D0KBG1_9GAMM|nr:helix-turn-helix domain-containing protein [Xenorhabdus stockiae]PHM60547.1 repressor [Xenorhabdus stockiae]